MEMKQMLLLMKQSAESKMLTESLGPDNSTDSVRHALYRRIQTQHVDLLTRHGLDSVMSAVEEVADDNADLEELGSSDITALMQHVISNLGEGSVMEADSDEELQLGTLSDEPLDYDAYMTLVMGEIMQKYPEFIEKHGEEAVRAGVRQVANNFQDEPLEGQRDTIVRQAMNYAARGGKPVEESSHQETADERLDRMYESALVEECDAGMATEPAFEETPPNQVTYTKTEHHGDAQVTVTATASSDAELAEILQLAGLAPATVEVEPALHDPTPHEEIVISSPELDNEFQDIDNHFTSGW